MRQLSLNAHSAIYLGIEYAAYVYYIDTLTHDPKVKEITKVLIENQLEYIKRTRQEYIRMADLYETT